MSDTRCNNCAFWRKVLFETGECRRRSPCGLSNFSWNGHRDGVWPVTKINDWCGEFSERRPMPEHPSVV